MNRLKNIILAQKERAVDCLKYIRSNIGTISKLMCLWRHFCFIEAIQCLVPHDVKFCNINDTDVTNSSGLVLVLWRLKPNIHPVSHYHSLFLSVVLSFSFPHKHSHRGRWLQAQISLAEITTWTADPIPFQTIHLQCLRSQLLKYRLCWDLMSPTQWKIISRWKDFFKMVFSILYQ